MKELSRALDTLVDTQNLASEIAQLLNVKHLVLLEGPMGVGKTEFVRALMGALNFEGVHSPSFAILNSYDTTMGSVDHVDLYRVESEDDLESTGFWDYYFRKKVASLLLSGQIDSTKIFCRILGLS